MLLAEITLQSWLTDLGSIFTAMTGYVGSICEMFMTTPVLMVSFGIVFAFSIIGLVKRLLH